MDINQFCEITKTQELSPELEGIHSTIVAIHGEADSYVILGSVSLLLKAGVPRFVIDRVVLALCRRSPDQLNMTLFGIIRNDILYFNNKSLGFEIADMFHIRPGFPVVDTDVLPTITLTIAVGAVREELGL